MGGISGVQCLKGTKKKYLIEEMIKSFKHRGNQSYIDNSFQDVCFGVRHSQRSLLSQVFAINSAKDLLVIMDGDIFQYPADDSVKNEAIGDAQIILELYQKYGKKFVDMIDGPYSIAIWNNKLKELILVRDRVGAKPIFYLKIKDTVVFSSEIKGILKSGLYEKSVDLNAVDNFLSYWYVPNPMTLFEGIFQVRPGYMMIFKEGRVSEEKYWRYRYEHSDLNKSESYYCEKYYDIFLKAVSRRLKKYPDAGAFLSGGMDSSSVAAAMAKISNSNFKVFSGGFKEKEYNEINDAKIVSDYLGLSHYATIIEFKDNFPNFFEKLVWLHDGPFSDTSAIPSYFASKLAKSEVDVVFTGDFPDQILGGSAHYMKALDRRENDTFLKFFIRNSMINGAVKKLPLSSGTSSFFDKMKRKIYRETFSIEMQQIISNMPVPELMKPCLYSLEMMAVTKKNDPLSYASSLYNEVSNYDLLDRMLYFDTHSYAPDDLMVKVDRMTMAHGLIAISPFHDREFVEFVATLPSFMKIKGREGKYIMRKAMGHLLPEHTLMKTKKGFDMPIDQWLIQKNPTYVKELLLDTRTTSRGYFNKQFLEQLVNNFLNQKTDYASGSSATIISLMTLELFHRVFIDNAA